MLAATFVAEKRELETRQELAASIGTGEMLAGDVARLDAKRKAQKDRAIEQAKKKRRSVTL